MSLTKVTTLLLFLLTLTFFACEEEEVTITPPDNTVDPVEITVTATDFSTTIDENPTESSVIGTVQGTTNEGTVSYELENVAPAGALVVNTSTGQLTVGNPDHFDFEINEEITATLRVSNGDVSETANIVIALNNLVLAESEGLIAHYPFDNDDINGTTALDATSNERHGTVHGAQLVADRWDDYNGGKRAYTFGNGSYIEIPSFGTDLTAFTISAWVLDNGVSEGYRCIVSKAGSGREYVLRVNSGSCSCLGAHFNSGTNGLHTGEVFATGVWKHIVMVYDNDTVAIYEDATMKANKESMTSPVWRSNDVTIGSLTDSGSEHWYGEIDEVSFFDRALTLPEIEILSANRRD